MRVAEKDWSSVSTPLHARKSLGVKCFDVTDFMILDDHRVATKDGLIDHRRSSQTVLHLKAFG
jgi:hypothetical protein